MAGLRVVLDTNVLVSGLAYPAGVPGRILGAWQQGALDVVLSKYILDEMARVLPKLSRNKRSPAEIRDLADSFLFKAEIVEPSRKVEKSLRDKADAPVLGTLFAAKADYLITGDKDLLALAEKCSIVTPAAFWERHGG
jgi:putative PIN family toxin of toxin-antitoxin system